MIRLTGLWKTKSKGRSGEVLSGKVTPNMQLLIVPNGQKQKASEPDFIAYLTEPAKEEQPEAEQPSQFGSTFAGMTGDKYG